MNGNDNITLSIGELAQQAGVSRRTIRFYVQRGLIDPPTGKGRGSHYTMRHVEQIARIRGLQRQGVPLDRIPDADADTEAHSDGSTAGLFAQTLVVRIALRDGVWLEVETSRALPSAEQLAQLAAECSRILDRDENE